ncbi:MAG: hypothetical protein H6726_27000 [Sandaracinaceae bacterium]|nr:hypothetical protein [Myxococcales bacterium]MCB9661326.1 hypothetical protein [Sandaracinaceae bacterium]
MQAAIGLTLVPDEDLEALIRLAYQGQIPFPLERRRLMELGLNRIADHASVIVGLDERALRAVVSAVLAERRRARGDERAKAR